ncbi:MAG: DUF262 domain-containing protein [Synergistaceae bacterium]|nr:DUF262 domain-containing protein [Synergistaceae bacterium]
MSFCRKKILFFSCRIINALIRGKKKNVRTFALPENGKFNPKSEYFLGSIVVFKNNNEQFEVIDGQQRLITLLLLLRAFHTTFEINNDNAFDSDKISAVCKQIAKCIWKTDEYYKPFYDQLKIDSQVATDDSTNELFNILREGLIYNESTSRYMQNYKFYLGKINELQNNKVNWLDLPNRILNNCVLFPITAGSQDTALRIFSTLNDRGKPLSDSDIFKVQLYKAFSAQGKRDDFIKKWQILEAACNKIFSSAKDTPMNELFNRYMHYERAIEGLKDSTQIGSRAFYERDNYKLFRVDHERVFKNLVMLANFWYDVFSQNEDNLSPRALKKLFILNYAPNSMWTFLVSVYYLHNQDSFDDEDFCGFLDKLTAFIWAFTIKNGGSSTNKLRPPFYKEMLNIVNNKPITFAEYR